MAPQALPAAITGKKAADLFAKGACTNTPQTPQKATAPRAAEATGWTSRYTAAPTNYPVFALKTANSALVWITTVQTRTLRKTNPRSFWTYGLPYTGIKKSGVIFRNKLTINSTAHIAIINPAKPPTGTAPKPAPLACGNVTTSYSGN